MSLGQGSDSESSLIQVCYENKFKRMFWWIRCDVWEKEDVEDDSEDLGLGRWEWAGTVLSEALGGTGFVGEARSLDWGSLYVVLSIRQTSRGAGRQ